MIRMGPCCIFLLLVLCQIRDHKAEDELSPMMVYKLLSARIDGVVHETKNLKSELAETKAVVKRIEQKIERIDDNVLLLENKIDKLKEHSNPISNEDDKSIQDAYESSNQRKLKTQAVILRNMLVNEKSHMRKKIEIFENKLETFQSDINKQLTSFETSIDNFNHLIADSLMSIENKVQTGDVETSKLIQEMNENIESKFIKSDTKVSQLVSNVNLSLESSKSGLNNRMNSAESKLRTLSSKQDRQEKTISGQISDLSRRIAVEEVRKVAFSSRMRIEQSSFGKNEKLVFDTIVYSYGGGYSSSTGIFTAPKSGTYLFTFNVQPSIGKVAHVVLVHESKKLTRAIVESDDDDVTGGNVGIVYVKVGEKVWVQTATLHANYYIWPYRTTFNGILID